MKKTLRFLLLLVGVLLFSLYTFSQALILVPDAASAEEILLARDILQGKAALSAWTGEIIALPLYLAGVKVFGPGTYVHVIVYAALWLLLCGCEWFCLHRLKMDTPLGVLFWLAVAALPDSTRMNALVSRADFSFLLLPGLLLLYDVIKDGGVIPNQSESEKGNNCSGSCAVDLKVNPTDTFPQKHKPDRVLNRKRMSAFAAAAAFLLAMGAYLRRAPQPGGGRDCLFALRALQQIFRADFSAQPLLKFSTGRYFLMSLVLLFFLAALFCVLLRLRKSCRLSQLYGVFLALTILFCALPLSGSLSEKVSLCAWVPFGAVVLLAAEYKDSGASELRITEARIPLSKVLPLLFLLLCLCGVNPIIRSRPANAADRLAAALREQGYTRGYCEPQLCARLEVAAKGNLKLSSAPDMEAPQFAVTESAEFGDIPTFHLRFRE